jgi:hypothetical protein
MQGVDTLFKRLDREFKYHNNTPSLNYLQIRETITQDILEKVSFDDNIINSYKELREQSNMTISGDREEKYFINILRSSNNEELIESNSVIKELLSSEEIIKSRDNARNYENHNPGEIKRPTLLNTSNALSDSESENLAISLALQMEENMEESSYLITTSVTTVNEKGNKKEGSSPPLRSILKR